MHFFLPYFIEDKVDAYVNDYISTKLQADIYYDSELTFFRHFPDVSYELADVRVSVGDRFQGDTIAFAERVDLLIPLFDLIKGENIKIKEVVAKKGSLIIIDPKNSSELYIYNINGSMKGESINGFSEIDLELLADECTFVKDSVVYFGGSTLGAEMLLNIDPISKKIEIGKNSISFNDIEIFTIGNASLQDKKLNVDFNMTTGECPVKSILESLTPFGFDYNLSGAGDCVLNVSLSGVFDNNTEEYPDMEIEIVFEGNDISVFNADRTIHSAFIDGKIMVVPSSGETILKYNLDSLNFDSLGASEIYGNAIISDNHIDIEETTMIIFDGNITASGTMDTEELIGGLLSAEIDCENIDLSMVVDELPAFGNFIPSSQSLMGRIDFIAEFTALFRENMVIDPYSIKGSGELSSKSIIIKESKAFENIKTVLQLGNEYQSRFDDLDIFFTVSNGIMKIEPFDTKVGDLKMNVSGEHGLDQSLNYLVKTEMPRSGLSSPVNSLIDIFASGLSAFGVRVPVDDNIKLDIKITGFFGKPVITPIL